MGNEQYYLGRQPILDRDQRIMGFEILFRSAASTGAALFDDCHAASASVMINALSDFGFKEVLGRYKGFFNVSLDMLMSDAVELLPREQVVIELLETIDVSDDVVSRCRELKAAGFCLALDDHVVSPAFEPLYETVDIVKLDVLQSLPDEIPAMLRQLRNWPLQILAEKVETVTQYELCAAQGFDLFQGYYFAHPVVLKRKKVDVTRLAMMQLMEKVLRDAEIMEIEEIFKQHPSLTFNLLRLVNSVAIGLREHIKSLRHAIMVLGTEQLKRWITLSLYAGGDMSGIQSPLLETAAYRGKLMELLVRQQAAGGIAADYQDQAFMTGVLSLIDVLLEIPMHEILDELSLAEDIRLALLSRSGDLGVLLQITEKLELSDFMAVQDLLRICSLSPSHLKISQLETFNWANRLGQSI